MFEKAGSVTKETVDWTTENVKNGAGHIYESASTTLSVVSDKLDESGISEKAGEAA